jgi:uncharacterized protein (TIGR02145 family)/prepilin-type N-terminal cleavage/methylation domain-containing protein
MLNNKSLTVSGNCTKLLKSKIHNLKSARAFTIIELLVVIAVIGILAAITLVSYSGISARATLASVQTDLSNASALLKVFQVTNPDGNFPDTINCAIPDSTTNKCLKTSGSTTYSYSSLNTSNPRVFTLTATNGTTIYHVTETSAPAISAYATNANWLTIGTQTWAKTNLNVGTMVTGATNQTNNSILEKYCYSDTEANCTTYGALYQWNEAMQYVTTPGAQGICPTNSHIPTDNDWKILEVQLGMTQAQADVTNDWRGTTQGTQMKPGGASGLDILFAGTRSSGGSFSGLLTGTLFWTSSESNTTAWIRNLSGYPTVYRTAYGKDGAWSIRCIAN